MAKEWTLPALQVEAATAKFAGQPKDCPSGRNEVTVAGRKNRAANARLQRGEAVEQQHQIANLRSLLDSFGTSHLLRQQPVPSKRPLLIEVNT